LKLATTPCTPVLDLLVQKPVLPLDYSPYVQPLRYGIRRQDINIHFVKPGVKVNGQYYRDVLLTQELLPDICQLSDFYVF